jgi:hypothetical protein
MITANKKYLLWVRGAHEGNYWSEVTSSIGHLGNRGWVSA